MILTFYSFNLYYQHYGNIESRFLDEIHFNVVADVIQDSPM